MTMDKVCGNVEYKFTALPYDAKGLALKLTGFYAVGWTLRKLVK